MINALRGEFYCSMPPIPPPHDRVHLLDTGPHERLKVQYDTLTLVSGIVRCHCKVVLYVYFSVAQV